MKRLIDTHCYFGKGYGIEASVGFYKKLQENIKDFYAKFLIMPFSRKGNLELPGIVKQNPDLFLGGLLQFNPNRDLEGLLGYMSPEQLGELIEEGGIVGLKLVTSMTRTKVNDPSVLPFVDLAIAKDIPIVFHCSATGQDFAHPDYFRKLKEKKRELKIVCAHYGGLNKKFIPGYIDLVKECSKERSCIYLNTAGLNGEIKRRDINNPSTIIKDGCASNEWVKIFKETVEDIQDYVVFGTNVGSSEFSLNPVDKVDETIQRKIVYDTSKKLFKLDF